MLFRGNAKIILILFMGNELNLNKFPSGAIVVHPKGDEKQVVGIALFHNNAYSTWTGPVRCETIFL
jgi:hypothetical protein